MRSTSVTSKSKGLRGTGEVSDKKKIYCLEKHCFLVTVLCSLLDSYMSVKSLDYTVKPIHLFSFYTQASDTGETFGLVQSTVKLKLY